MAIRVQNQTFYLETKNSLYQMQVDQFGVLIHLWYGEKTAMDMTYLLEYPDVGFAGNIYDAGDVRTYSLNTRPQEYPTVGTGDYRVSALSVEHSDGSNALDLRYESYDSLGNVH